MMGFRVSFDCSQNRVARCKAFKMWNGPHDTVRARKEGRDARQEGT